MLLAGLACDSQTGGTKPGEPKPVFGDLAQPSFGDPIWSPDGTRLGFNHAPLETISVDSDGRHQYRWTDSLQGFWMINADGSGLQRVLSFHLEDPDWSNDGVWIAYARGGDIWRIRTTSGGVDSTSAEQLTFQGVFAAPAFDARTTKLAFFRPSGAASGIYWMGAGGGGSELIGERGWQGPDWSPDSSKLIFIGSVGSAYGIGCADSLGRNPRILQASLVTHWYPRWSPDGDQIAFTARSPETQITHLWVMKRDGSQLRKASSDPVGHGFSWAPDSKRIAYVRHGWTDFNYENGTVWIVDIQTHLTHQLTFNRPPSP
jgi:Tol biopolymer transport system component